MENKVTINQKLIVVLLMIMNVLQYLDRLKLVCK